MEAIYSNNFRIALPVAFPATRRPAVCLPHPFDGIIAPHQLGQDVQESSKYCQIEPP